MNFPMHLDWPNGSSTLAAGGYTAASGVANLATGTGTIFGSPSPSSPLRFTIASQNAPGTCTHFTCTGRTGDQLTGVTVLDGTDRNYVAGDTVESRAYVADFTDIYGILAPLVAVAGIVKVSSGTPAAAVAGTDYLAPFGSQTQNEVYASPTGSSGAPTFRALVAADIPTISSGQVSGLAPSATTDTTNASNISSGTLGAARLPNPSATTLGGVKSYAAVTSQWINAISTAGAPSSTQPGFGDLSGSAAVGQLPVMVASGASHAAGIAPDPGVTAGTTHFLREDATWAVPAGGGTPGGSPGNLQFDNAGAFGGTANLSYGSSGQLSTTESAAPGSPANNDRWADSTQHTEAYSVRGITSYRSGLLFSTGARSSPVTASGQSSLLPSTISLPANYFNVAGQILHFRSSGLVTTAASSPGSSYLYLKLGSTVVATTPSQTLVAAITNLGWIFDVEIVCQQAGSSGLLDFQGVLIGVGGNTWAIALNQVLNASAGGTTTTSQISANLTTSLALDFGVNFSATTNSITRIVARLDGWG